MATVSKIDQGSIKNPADLKKVSLNLTNRDIENLKFLKEVLNERSQVSVISRSLALVSQLTKALQEDENSKLIIVNGRKGEDREILLAGY